jgi:hypothetical protein
LKFNPFQTEEELTYFFSQKYLDNGGGALHPSGGLLSLFLPDWSVFMMIENERFNNTIPWVWRVSLVFPKKDISEINNLIMRNFDQIKSSNYGLLNWMMMKYLAVLISYYFRYWQNISASQAKLQKAPSFIKLTDESNNEVPLLMFNHSFNIQSHIPVKFIMSPDVSIKIAPRDDLICPYNSISKRKINTKEISHHPMNLAVNNKSSSIKEVSRFLRNLDIFRIN